MYRRFTYRLYPNKTQTRLLAVVLDTHRHLYNECLDYRKLAWETHKTSITFHDQRRWFTKNWRNHPYYSRLNNNSALQTIERLELAFQAFFRRIKAGEKPGHPRFRGQGQFNSINYATYPQGLVLIGDRIRVHHVGMIKVKLHRPYVGLIKTATLKRNADKWYVIFSCDHGDVKVEPNGLPEVGVDVGIASFLATSDGKKELNPQYFKREHAQLRRLQRSASRKKKGGKNRKKAAILVAKLHARIRNLRRDHHHKTALKLVQNYGFIAVEKLRIRNMVRSRLAGLILDAGWGQFLTILCYKAESAGTEVAKVIPEYTSQTCSRCGHCEKENRRSQKKFQCRKCGLEMNADHNAAVNILAKARQLRTEAAGHKSGNSRAAPRSAVASSNFKYRKKKLPKIKPFQRVFNFG